jgi:predicted AlkP superfamily pyrophosphatase or phosphodiesterase
LADENPYEPKLNNGTSSFPYDLKQLIETRGLGALKNTPVGNELVVDMALLLLEKEELGKDKYTDFLGVSFSSTDYAGHTFGVRSREVHDMYLKLDRQLGKLIKKLDKEVGRDSYVIYLTADHGASENPNHLAYHGLGVRNFQNADVIGDVNERIKEELGIENAVFKIFNHHIHLNSWAKERAGEIALVVEATDPFMRVYTASEVRNSGNDALLELLHEGHQSRFGGDLIFALQPNCIFYGPYGSTHGTGYLYDTHVPFLLMGNGIKKGESFKRVDVTNIVDKVAEKCSLPYAPNSLVE